MTQPKASVRIHSTGTIVVTGATSQKDVMDALHIIYERVSEFRCDASKVSRPRPRKRQNTGGTDAAGLGVKRSRANQMEDEDVSGNYLLFEDEADLYDDEDVLK